MSTSVTEATVTTHSTTSAPRRALGLLGRYYLVAVLLIGFALTGLASSGFWTEGNLRNILFEAGFVAIAACGMLLLIVNGLLDLSVAGIIALSAIAVATVLPSTTIGAAIGLAAVIGAALGAINGVVVTFLKIPPFIATLGTQYLFLGAAFVWTNGKVVSIASRNFRGLVTGSIGFLPNVFIIAALLAVLTWVILFRTSLGRNLRSIGSNERAAEVAGINVRATKIGVFAIAGTLFAVAGVFLAGRLSSAEGNMAIGVEMGIIAAVVVGGTSLRGGRGTVLGTILGAILFAWLANALNMLGVASYWQRVVTGSVLVIAVAIGMHSSRETAVRGEG